MSGRVVLLASLLLSVGCASHVTQSSGMSAPIQAGMAITVMSSNVGSGPAGGTLSRELVECVIGAIRRRLPDVRVVPATDFARATFPDLPPESAPLSPESLAVLVEDPVFMARVERSGARFLVTVGGRTTQTVMESEVSGGGGVPGFAGYWVWRRDTSVGAAVYDFGATSTVGKVDVEVSGCPWFAVVDFFPLGAPSSTEAWACSKLGGAVVELLRGRPVPTP